MKKYNKIFYGKDKIENVTLYEYGIILENAINCKIKVNVTDGDNVEHELSFVKNFSITSDTIFENKPSAEEKDKEPALKQSLVDLEIIPNSKLDEFSGGTATKISYIKSNI